MATVSGRPADLQQHDLALGRTHDITGRASAAMGHRCEMHVFELGRQRNRERLTGCHLNKLHAVGGDKVRDFTMFIHRQLHWSFRRD